jgi:PBSX family phage terminase large subunit
MRIYKLVNAPGGVKLRGAVQMCWGDKSPEFIVCGPADSSKTFGLLMRLDALCWKYPNLQAAIIRKRYTDLTGSVVQTYLRKIVKLDAISVFGGEHPQWFDYPTGSRIWLGGIDKPGKSLSTERDFIYVNQAEELELEDWETLTTRTSGRAGNSPYSQLFGDCNPSFRSHWIPARAKEGKLVLYNSKHTDNPELFDDNGTITEKGKKRLLSLSSLTGMRRKRLFEGEWATAEGVVYDSFSVSIHVKHRDPGEFQYWCLSMDEGYTNPAAIILIGVDGDMRIHIAEEFYETGKLQSQVVDTAKEMAHSIGGRIAVCVVDSSAAGLIADLKDVGLPAEPHHGRVLDGIAIVQELLKVQGDGLPRLTIDPSCVNAINEFESYVWKPGKDEPIKENDHIADSVRYFCDWLFAGEIEVSRVVYDPPQIGNY